MWTNSVCSFKNDSFINYEFAEVTSQDSDTVRSLLHRVVDIVTDSEKAPKVPYQSGENVSWSETVTHGLTWFNIGPSRSMWIIGFFIPIVWAFGTLYIFSSIRFRIILHLNAL